MAAEGTPMPQHIKFLLKHAVFGALIAAVFVAMVLWANVANLWHLVTHTDEGPLAVFLLWVFCAITFGSVQMGIRIMTMSDRNGD
jgi:polyferredoxin